MPATMVWKEFPSPATLAGQVMPQLWEGITEREVADVIREIVVLGYTIQRDVIVPAEVAEQIVASIANPETAAGSGRHRRGEPPHEHL